MVKSHVLITYLQQLSTYIQLNLFFFIFLNTTPSNYFEANPMHTIF
jgi:hypothetical protein